METSSCKSDPKKSSKKCIVKTNLPDVDLNARINLLDYMYPEKSKNRKRTSFILLIKLS